MSAVVVDNGDGTYGVTYNTTVAADYQLSVTLNGVTALLQLTLIWP